MSQPDGTDGDPGFWADYDDFCDEDSGTLTFDYQFWNPATSSWEEIESDSVSVGDHTEGTNWPSTYLSGGEWQWDVTATNDEMGSSDWGWQTLEIEDTPYTPTLAAPSSGETVPDPRATLTASAENGSGDTTYYHFQIATSSGACSSGTGLYGDFAWVATGSLPLTGGWPDPASSSITNALEPDQTYYWRAQAANGWGAGTWSGCSSFSVAAAPDLGSDSAWPMWSSGPLAVNEANGNLVLSVPTPSFPTAAGTLGVSIAYNSRGTGANEGLGPNWVVGVDGAEELIDENYATNPVDEFERVLPDGSSEFYQHVAGSQEYLPPDASSSQLTLSSDGNTLTLIDDDGSVYTFTKASDYSSNHDWVLSGEQSYSSNANVGELVYGYTSGKLTSIAAMDGSTTIATLS